MANAESGAGKDLGAVVTGLFEEFKKRFQEIKKPEDKFTDDDSEVWEAMNEWFQYGQIQIFDENLTITLMRNWQIVGGDIPWREFDPRPGVERKIKIELPFKADNFERLDWDIITEELQQRIRRLPEINYNNN